MAKTALSILKGWFKTNSYPTQAQFWSWMDSYWHKDDKIAADSIGGLQELLDQKVSEEEGKGLSSNDYSTEEKEKLAGLDEALNNKVSIVEGKGLSTNDYSTEEKEKLASLQKSGTFFQGATVTEKDGEIVQVIKTYTTGETKETRIQRTDGVISKIEEKDSLLLVATISVFENGLPTPTNTTVPVYTDFSFSIDV